MNMCRSIGFCQFKQNWVHKRAACQLVITMVFAWNNFLSKTAHQAAERVCHPGYGVTSLLHPRLLLTCLLRQAQLSDTARNFHSFFWHNVKFLSFIFKAGRFGSANADIRHVWEEDVETGGEKTSASRSKVATAVIFFLICVVFLFFFKKPERRNIFVTLTSYFVGFCEQQHHPRRPAILETEADTDNYQVLRKYWMDLLWRDLFCQQHRKCLRKADGRSLVRVIVRGAAEVTGRLKHWKGGVAENVNQTRFQTASQSRIRERVTSATSTVLIPDLYAAAPHWFKRTMV